ncbi:hypothetical protein CEXT_614071 [Caerostris extrusa]|uniref:Granulins domain-containing protein n=1 Tax=Caerostris extrusa TaxID=172846 RepID=A0AAV4QXR7_CAEEX|nr:hypothetical protein CEXT_614071 [Caerostris extrusa]
MFLLIAFLLVSSTISAFSDESLCQNCQPKETCCVVPDCLSDSATCYSCCPVENGICCPDTTQCCPQGYSCDSSTYSCIPDDISTSNPSFPTFQKRSGRFLENKLDNNRCDKKSYCPDDATCCLIYQDVWGCCPYANGVCCSDGVRCCPEGESCDVTSQYCVRRHTGGRVDLKDEAEYLNWSVFRD